MKYKQLKKINDFCVQFRGNTTKHLTTTKREKYSDVISSFNINFSLIFNIIQHKNISQITQSSFVIQFTFEILIIQTFHNNITPVYFKQCLKDEFTENYWFSLTIIRFSADIVFQIKANMKLQDKDNEKYFVIDKLLVKSRIGDGHIRMTAKNPQLQFAGE